MKQRNSYVRGPGEPNPDEVIEQAVAATESEWLDVRCSDKLDDLGLDPDVDELDEAVYRLKSNMLVALKPCDGTGLFELTYGYQTVARVELSGGRILAHSVKKRIP